MFSLSLNVLINRITIVILLVQASEEKPVTVKTRNREKLTMHALEKHWRPHFRITTEDERLPMAQQTELYSFNQPALPKFGADSRSNNAVARAEVDQIFSPMENDLRIRQLMEELVLKSRLVNRADILESLVPKDYNYKAITRHANSELDPNALNDSKTNQTFLNEGEQVEHETNAMNQVENFLTKERVKEKIIDNPLLEQFLNEALQNFENEHIEPSQADYVERYVQQKETEMQLLKPQNAVIKEHMLKPTQNLNTTEANQKKAQDRPSTEIQVMNYTLPRIADELHVKSHAGDNKTKRIDALPYTATTMPQILTTTHNPTVSLNSVQLLAHTAQDVNNTLKSSTTPTENINKAAVYSADATESTKIINIDPANTKENLTVQYDYYEEVSGETANEGHFAETADAADSLEIRNSEVTTPTNALKHNLTIEKQTIGSNAMPMLSANGSDYNVVSKPIAANALQTANSNYAKVVELTSQVPAENTSIAHNDGSSLEYLEAAIGNFVRSEVANLQPNELDTRQDFQIVKANANPLETKEKRINLNNRANIIKSADSKETNTPVPVTLNREVSTTVNCFTALPPAAAAAIDSEKMENHRVIVKACEGLAIASDDGLNRAETVYHNESDKNTTDDRQQQQSEQTLVSAQMHSPAHESGDGDKVHNVDIYNNQTTTTTMSTIEKQSAVFLEKDNDKTYGIRKHINDVQDVRDEYVTQAESGVEYDVSAGVPDNVETENSDNSAEGVAAEKDDNNSDGDDDDDDGDVESIDIMPHLYGRDKTINGNNSKAVKQVGAVMKGETEPTQLANDAAQVLESPSNSNSNNNNNSNSYMGNELATNANANEAEITTTNWWHTLSYAEIRKFLNTIFDSAAHELYEEITRKSKEIQNGQKEVDEWLSADAGTISSGGLNSDDILEHIKEFLLSW